MGSPVTRSPAMSRQNVEETCSRAYVFLPDGTTFHRCVGPSVQATVFGALSKEVPASAATQRPLPVFSRARVAIDVPLLGEGEADVGAGPVAEGAVAASAAWAVESSPPSS